MPRMAVTGTLGDHAVTGTAWLDRAWGDLPAPGGPLAYARLIAHMEDGTNLSVLRTSRRDGRGGATVDGGLSGGGLGPRALSDGVTMTPESDARLSWSLAGEGLDLRIAPMQVADGKGDAVPVTQALVSITGTRDDMAVSGTGTLQLTGFDAP
jgi:predicted secreted hydrolase